jgi:hypothetical protein
MCEVLVHLGAPTIAVEWRRLIKGPNLFLDCSRECCCPSAMADAALRAATCECAASANQLNPEQSAEAAALVN